MSYHTDETESYRNRRAFQSEQENDSFGAVYGMHVVARTGEPAVEPFTGERRLLFEVLRQVFADLEHERGEIRDDAAAWLEDDDETTPEDGTFTFRQLCAELRLTPANIRAAALDPDRRRAVLTRLRKEWREGTTKRTPDANGDYPCRRADGGYPTR